MKRAEKNAETKHRIIKSALKEFSEKSYREASLNTICIEGEVSKGIIYHYYQDKEELYLACVKECFNSLKEYLDQKVKITDDSLEKNMNNYFKVRLHFFNENPIYFGIYCSAVLNPPDELEKKLNKAMKEFHEQTIKILSALLKKTKLRKGITNDEVIETFSKYQDWVNTRAQKNKKVSLREHELKTQRTLKILLYGVVESEK